MNVWAEKLSLARPASITVEAPGVRRGCGVGLSRGGAVAVAVARSRRSRRLAVAVCGWASLSRVGVADGVGVGVGLGAAAQYLPPVLKNGGKERSRPKTDHFTIGPHCCVTCVAPDGAIRGGL